MEYEKCYRYEHQGGRSAKRRRLEPQGLQASWKLRHRAYQQAWRREKQNIEARLHNINERTVSELAAFLQTPRQADGGRIPTAIIASGPVSASHASVLHELAHPDRHHTKRCFVVLSSNAATNLKACLRHIIQKATAASFNADDADEEVASSRKGVKLLNYDLRILFDHVQEHDIGQVVLAFEDTDAFDSVILSELIELFGCWSDRIPFCFLFNIATSVDMLRQRLSSKAIRYLDGRLFDVAGPAEEIEQIVDAITTSETALWIGSDLLSMLLERQCDYIESADTLVDALQYAYMSHYYANSLSIFQDDTVHFSDVPTDHWDALRATDSFREFCKRLLADGEVRCLRDLLDGDQSLFKFVRDRTREGVKAIANIVSLLRVIQQLEARLKDQQHSPMSKLYIQALSNKLAGSSHLRSLLLSIRKSSSDITTSIIEDLVESGAPEDIREECEKIQDELRKLMITQSDLTLPLRSEDDVQNSTLRTTVVAQKVELSKQKSALSKQDAAYTALLRRFTDLLDSYFTSSLIDPRSLVFHEIFLYDLRSPHREVFMPRCRHAIERALASPHDYLDCQCCAPERGAKDEATLASSQPATALLYQLYLESGSLMNASDLWQAFQAVVGEGRTDEENMALFQRSVAELRYLGLVKSTRKRVDHIAKVAWKGL